MSVRLFDGKEQVTYYAKYMIRPQKEITDQIFSYLNERLPKPHGFAVDIGCGSGQSTPVLAPYFEKVLGIDISEAQIEEAKKALELPNVMYRVCPAEEVPVGDASVDLVTASTAAHWFDIEQFLKEVDRILKPRGCLALFSINTTYEVHYKDCSEQMTRVMSELISDLVPYEHERIKHTTTGYQEIFDAIPYNDKWRNPDVVTKIPMSVATLMGFIQSLVMFQSYYRAKPEEAKERLKTVEQRFLQIMGTSCTQTVVEVWFQNVLVLACKPE